MRDSRFVSLYTSWPTSVQGLLLLFRVYHPQLFFIFSKKSTTYLISSISHIGLGCFEGWLLIFIHPIQLLDISF